MLLSIVECSDYRLSNSKDHFGINIQRLSDELECVGPVVAANVAKMRNMGAVQAQGRWLFFKDADCKIKPLSILEIVQKLEAKNTGFIAVSGVYNSNPKGFWQKVYHRIQLIWLRNGLQSPPEESFVEAVNLLGGAFLIKKDVFVELQGFNEQIGWGGEETELVQRLRQRGLKTAVCFDLQVNHYSSIGLGGFLKRAWFQNFNRALFQADQNLNIEAKFNYLKAPLPTLVATLLFFTVAQFAFNTGRIYKWAFFRKKTIYGASEISIQN